jgi:hypothetical protein
VRFQDAAPDARAIVYAGIQADPLVARAAALLADASLPQRLLARAVMNGERTTPDSWREVFPSLLAPGSPGRERSEEVLAVSLEVADRGEQARSQYRGAIVESLTAVLLARRTGPVRRERRILFDGVRAEIHPYDVTVEAPGAAEAWDCKWGARGIGPDVIHQLDDARRHAAGESERLLVGLVIFDAARSCGVRLDRQTAPTEGVRLVTLERLDRLAGAPVARSARPAERPAGEPGRG